MSQFSSTIQILVVEEKQIPARNGREAFTARSGRAILFADDGSVTTVGRLRIPDSLADQAKQGTFRASFSLQVPDYGNDKGDIVAVLTGLSPVERKAPAPKA